jgi:hypothetical protein
MKAQDLAGYFAMKIAQPMPFDYLYQARGIRTKRTYVVEPVAVDDHVLHVMVTLKSETLLDSQLKLRTEPVMCGEVEIPLADEDSVTTVLRRGPQRRLHEIR